MSITWKNALKQQPHSTVAFSSLISQIKKTEAQAKVKVIQTADGRDRI